MFQDKILKSVADAVKDVMAEQLKGDQHKIDKNKNGKVDAHDFKLLRKEESPKKPASPFDWKNTPRQTAEKGEKTGHDSKKISTGTVYTKRYTKEEASQAEFNAEIKKAQDKSTGKIKADVAKPAVQAVKQESVEQIDELSKTTLGSYIKKASHDVAARGAATRQFANDSRDATKKQEYDVAKKSMDKADKTFAKGYGRRMNMAKAVDRLTKEEVEIIDELSKGTLKRYSDAAHKDFSKNFQHDQNFTGIHSAIRTAMAKTNSGTGGVHSLKGTNKNPLRKHDGVQAGLKTAADALTAARAPFKHKMKVRNQGMDRADARLNKEEIEKIDEVSLALAKRARDKASDIALRDRDGMERDKPYGHSEKQRVKFQRYVNKKAPSAADAVDRLTREEVEINERTLTASEAEKKEDIVKGMKKNLAGFKERYGKDAKSVMYATATKNAKKD